MDLQNMSGSPLALEVEPKLRRILYPLIILLISLPKACEYPYRLRKEIEAPSFTGSPEQIFCNFVNKLAFMCWTDVSSAAISACTVLHPLKDDIEYTFAFNNRSAHKLEELAEDIRKILSMFHRSSSSDERKKEILRELLSVNVNRVRCYLRGFHKYLGECINACVRDNNNDSVKIAVCLRGLQEAAIRTLKNPENGVQDQVDIVATEQLIWKIHGAYKSSVFSLVQARVLTEERHGPSTPSTTPCWTELIHVVGRLMTYKQAIDVSLRVGEIWPELFDRFHINMVPSQACNAQIVNKEHAMSAKDIIKKATAHATPGQIQEAYDGAEKLQTLFPVDEKIENEWPRKSIAVCVHAEINLLQYLENSEGGTDEARFFQGIKYIGTAKPPCKLCHYYFEASTDVEVPPSHRNLYLPWLIPDSGTHQPRDLRMRIVRKIIPRLFLDLLQVLKNRESDGRLRDSSGYSTRHGIRSQYPLDTVSFMPEPPSVPHSAQTDDTDSTHLPSRSEELVDSPVREMHDLFSGLSVSPSHSTARATHAAAQWQDTVNVQIPSRVTVYHEADEDDDDGGGVLLFKGRKDRN